MFFIYRTSGGISAVLGDFQASSSVLSSKENSVVQSSRCRVFSGAVNLEKFGTNLQSTLHSLEKGLNSDGKVDGLRL